MKIDIATNLKRLRKEHDITQEKLADAIGVSYQAVSKWERGVGYPDITILPEIAAFFGVSTDEILGIGDRSPVDGCEEIFARFDKLWAESKIDMCIELCREGLKAHPNNYRLMQNYAAALAFEEGEDYELLSRKLKEAIEIERKILDDCSEGEIRTAVSENLSYHCSKEKNNIPK